MRASERNDKVAGCLYDIETWHGSSATRNRTGGLLTKSEHGDLSDARASQLPTVRAAMFYLGTQLDTRDRSTLARRTITTPRSPQPHTPLGPASAPLHATAQQKTCAPNKTQNGQPRARTVVHATHIQCAHRRGYAHPAGTRHRHTPCTRGTRRSMRNRTNCFAWPTRRTPYPGGS
jgi:hypothetical protein